MLMRESLLDKDVMASTETPVVRMLPDAHVVKIGGRSMMDPGRDVLMPLVEAIGEACKTHRLNLGPGGGVRRLSAVSIGLGLGLPTAGLVLLSVVDGRFIPSRPAARIGR